MDIRAVLELVHLSTTPTMIPIEKLMLLLVYQQMVVSYTTPAFNYAGGNVDSNYDYNSATCNVIVKLNKNDIIIFMEKVMYEYFLLVSLLKD